MVKYQELWNEENTNIRERYDLAMERILEIPSEERVAEPYRSYFNQMAAFTAQIEELARLQLREDLDAFTLEELQQLNDRLYADILPEHYTESYANPAYAVRMLGADLGPLLSAFYAQFRAAIVFAYECRLTDITILCETLIEIYNMFEDSEPQARAVRDVLYWFFSDYTDVTLTYRIREQGRAGSQSLNRQCAKEQGRGRVSRNTKRQKRNHGTCYHCIVCCLRSRNTLRNASTEFEVRTTSGSLVVCHEDCHDHAGTWNNSDYVTNNTGLYPDRKQAFRHFLVRKNHLYFFVVLFYIFLEVFYLLFYFFHLRGLLNTLDHLKN